MRWLVGCSYWRWVGATVHDTAADKMAMEEHRRTGGWTMRCGRREGRFSSRLLLRLKPRVATAKRDEGGRSEFAWLGGLAWSCVVGGVLECLQAQLGSDWDA